MRLEFEGSYEEYLQVFGHAAPRPVQASAPAAPVQASAPAAASFPQQQFPDYLVGQGERSEMAFPQEAGPQVVDLPKLTPEERASSWTAFCQFCREWVEGFEQSGAKQPDRVAMMFAAGSGPHVRGILVQAFEILSLQRMIEKALVEQELRPPLVSEEEWLNYIDRVAGTMVQVSHAGFPELAGTYDFSQRWRRIKP